MGKNRSKEIFGEAHQDRVSNSQKEQEPKLEEHDFRRELVPEEENGDVDKREQERRGDPRRPDAVKRSAECSEHVAGKYPFFPDSRHERNSKKRSPHRPDDVVPKLKFSKCQDTRNAIECDVG